MKANGKEPTGIEEGQVHVPAWIGGRKSLVLFVWGGGGVVLSLVLCLQVCLTCLVSGVCALSGLVCRL